jgi:hypothetical protein
MDPAERFGADELVGADRRVEEQQRFNNGWAGK